MQQVNLNVDQLRALIRQVIKQVLQEEGIGTKNSLTHSAAPLTEKRLMNYGAQHVSKVVITDHSVVTPLAKAKARKLGIEIVRQDE